LLADRSEECGGVRTRIGTHRREFTFDCAKILSEFVQQYTKVATTIDRTWMPLPQASYHNHACPAIKRLGLGQSVRDTKQPGQVVETGLTSENTATCSEI